MTLLFGQFPQRAYAMGQFVLHALVGSVGDPVVPPIPPIPPPDGGHIPVGDGYHPTYLRRSAIQTSQDTDEDVILALAAFTMLEHNDLPS